MMFFPIRKCTFVLRCLLLLLLAIMVMFVLLQLNTPPRLILPNEVMPLQTKELRATQIAPISVSNLKPFWTKAAMLNHLNVSTQNLYFNIRDMNRYNFPYLLTPTKLCDNKSIYLLIYVHSAPLNFKKRMSIRETWGFPSILNKFQARLVFFIGRVTNAEVMSSVRLEANQYDDVIQEDYLDTYRNLSYKAIGALRWISHFCAHAKYVLKTDDDVFVNLFRLLNYMHLKLEGENRKVTDLLLCNQWINMKVIRNEKSKWYLSHKDFAPDTFPPYCSGSAFLMSNDVVHRMCDATRSTPFFWIDDYYLTGMVFKNLQIKHTRFNEAYSLNGLKALERFQSDNTTEKLVFFHTSKIRDMYSLWTTLQQNRIFKRNL